MEESQPNWLRSVLQVMGVQTLIWAMTVTPFEIILEMNVNTKEMLAYVISVFEEYGITYMDGEDIVRAKKNEQGG